MRIPLFLLLLTTIVFPARAQQMPLQVNLSHSTFAYDAGQALVEVYLAFEADGLDYESTADGYVARLPIDLGLYRSTAAGVAGTPSEAVWADSITLHFSVPDTAMLQPGQQFIHQVRALAPPGEYELRLMLPAQGTRAEVEVRRDVLVPDYSDETTTRVSDLTLASSISQGGDVQDPFYKNGLLIRPNAAQLYGEGLPRLFYYAEIYEPGRALGTDTYTLLTYVSEANRPQAVAELERRVERPVRPVDVVVGSFSMAALPSGPYLLRMVVLNASNEAIAERQQRFFVYNPGVAGPEANAVLEMTFETSPYAVMPEEEVDRMFQHIEAIASDGDRRRMRNLDDLDTRRRFLMEFWAVRDPNPGTEINEYKDEFYQRLQYADDRYSSAGREGWKTDRGRVLLKYGLPSAIDPHLFDRETKPYEVWQYNNIPGQGQAEFIFYDPRGFGDFELLHATVTGERQSPNWQSELRR